MVLSKLHYLFLILLFCNSFILFLILYRKQVKIGYTCISNLISNLTNLPIAVICDLLYSEKIIQSLYNAIETCITESTTTVLDFYYSF